MSATQAPGAAAKDGGPRLGARPDLPQPRDLELEVAAVGDLSPNLRRVEFRGEDLRSFRFAPGQDLMFRFSVADSRTVNRRYTIRRADPERCRVEIMVVMHGEGPAARWARSLRVGQLVPQVVGPRGKVTLVPGVRWHLFLGDETYIPGTLAMLEALPRNSSARALLEVSGREDEQPLRAAASAELEWLPRGELGRGSAENLSRHLAALQLPSGPGHVYIAAELRVALRLRDELFARGLSRDQVSAKGYWIAGRANAERGEPDLPQ